MKKGFTLIELILTISIIIIILSVGIYKSSIVSDYEALKSMDELFENLRYSRNLAISQKNSSKITFFEDNSYEIKCNKFREKYRLSQKIDMSMANDKYGRKSITFTKSGAPSYSNAQTITLRYGNKEYFITIEPVTGKVNFKK